MEQDEAARLREDLRRWRQLLYKQSDPRVCKVLQELIEETRKRLCRLTRPPEKSCADD